MRWILEYALLLAIPIKLIVDLIKSVTKGIAWINKLEISPYYYSITVGIFLSTIFLPHSVDIYYRILIGVIAGALPAPAIHDLLMILKNLKDALSNSE